MLQILGTCVLIENEKPDYSSIRMTSCGESETSRGAFRFGGSIFNRFAALSFRDDSCTKLSSSELLSSSTISSISRILACSFIRRAFSDSTLLSRFSLERTCEKRLFIAEFTS